MTKDRAFTTEVKISCNPSQIVTLRTLYMPIIGVVPTSLYSLLADFHDLNKNVRTYDPFASLIDALQITEGELEVALKKLEAVGLIRTFQRTDESKYIFLLNEPLAAEAFRKNSFLYKQVIAKIGEIAFEKIEFSSKETSLSKDDFMEVTAKYQDIFSIEVPVEQTKLASTQEIPLIKYESIEDALLALNSFQFVKFLGNENVTPTQQAMLQRITQLGLANPSVNLITNYVFNVNGKIVSAHIEKIANDLVSKDVKGFEEIKAELLAAEKSKQSSVFDVEATRVSSEVKVVTQESKDSLSWDDIFSSLGGEL